MNEFEPLRETSASAFERALLRSAERDEPSPLAFGKTAAAFGVGATLVGTTGTTAAAGGSGSAIVTFWTFALKPLFIGAAGGLVVAVSTHQLSAPSDAPKHGVPVVSEAPRARTEPSVATLRAPVDGVTVPPPAVALPVTTDATHRAPETASRAARDVSGSPVPAPLPADSASPTPSPDVAAALPEPPRAAPNASASIASEVATIDRARQALRDGRPSDALHELDVYRLAWPSGVLATEAAVLRIEAHLALGDRASGIRAARAFLAATPRGRYATRVRALFKPSELK